MSGNDALTRIPSIVPHRLLKASLLGAERGIGEVATTSGGVEGVEGFSLASLKGSELWASVLRVV